LKILTTLGLILFFGSLIAMFFQLTSVELLRLTLGLGVILTLGPSCIGAWDAARSRKWYW